MADKVRVGVLGATGLVGQMFVKLLDNHPWFEASYLASSPQSSGAKYRDAAEWSLGGMPPAWVSEMVLGDASRPEEVPGDVEMVFSALPRDVSAPIEAALARRGLVVVSNAGSMRLEPDIPLLNPEVNYEHLGLLETQHRRRGWRGAVLKVPNCSTAILTLSLAPIINTTGLRRLVVTTLQAISGAGLRGLSGHAILGNVIPLIKGEEEKIMGEARKILGELREDGVKPLDAEIHATATRVPVLDGHLESIHMEPEHPTRVEEIREAIEEYSPLRGMSLPSAPSKPVLLAWREDRPQPRLDVWAGGGMSVTVGRLRSSGWISYVALGHNLVRGAAGTGILIAELYLKATGLK